MYNLCHTNFLVHCNPGFEKSYKRKLKSKKVQKSQKKHRLHLCYSATVLQLKITLSETQK